MDIFQYGLTVDSAFLKLAESDYDWLEEVTGRRFDTATLGGAAQEGQSVSCEFGAEHESGPRVDIFQYGLTVDSAFLKLAESDYDRLEEVTGRRFDTATLGRVRIYVSAATGIAHVGRGYQHASDPKGIVFLSPRVYAGALDGTISTYVHEMAHLLTWRFHSHTSREGLATYLAQEIIPGSSSDERRAGHEDRPAGPDLIQKPKNQDGAWLPGF